ncbi:MAG: NAD(P)/FAD-dependent oxidoreductase [Pseudomonadota bacterium]
MSDVDVAIIGAGAAGIAACRMLQAAGLTVQVLEARYRVGGRAHTEQMLGLPVDMGAAWLHFAEENAFTGIAQEGGFTVIRREPNWGGEALIGARTPTVQERQQVGQSWERYYALVEAAAAAGLDVAVSDVLPMDEFRTRFDAVMTWAVGVESAAASTLDLARYAESTHNWAVAQGLGSVVAHAGTGLPITLGAEVTGIGWDEKSVRIDTARGAIRARAAIVTVPTSVLANEEIKFKPPLPARFVTACNGIALGVVNKVFIRVDEALLPFAGTTQLIGTDTTSRTASYTVRPAGQPLIAAFFGGELSRELEQRGQLATFACDELQRIFGADLVNGILATHATGWGQDRWSRGSYSAARPGQADQRAVLSEPVSPTLSFAGEACSREHYGTLHGAWQSGRKAARRLIAHLEKLGYVSRSAGQRTLT